MTLMYSLVLCEMNWTLNVDLQSNSVKRDLVCRMVSYPNRSGRLNFDGLLICSPARHSPVCKVQNTLQELSSSFQPTRGGRGRVQGYRSLRRSCCNDPPRTYILTPNLFPTLQTIIERWRPGSSARLKCRPALLPFHVLVVEDGPPALCAHQNRRTGPHNRVSVVFRPRGVHLNGQPTQAR